MPQSTCKLTATYDSAYIKAYGQDYVKFPALKLADCYATVYGNYSKEKVQ